MKRVFQIRRAFFFREWHTKSLKSEQNQENNDTINTIRFVMSDIYYPNTDTVKKYSKRNYYDNVEKKVYKINFHWGDFFMYAGYFILQPYAHVYIYPDSIFHKLKGTNIQPH